MCFCGPAPHHSANIRKAKAAIREKETKSTPCSGDIPPELISVEQVPSVQTPSVFDDAVESAKAIESKLLVNVDGLLAKAEGIQKSIQGAFADVQSAVGGAIAEAEGALGGAIAGAQDAIQGGIKSAFSSVENMFAGSGSKDCVALGVPDTQKIDSKAFGGGLGAAADLPVDSIEEDAIQAELGEQLAAGGLPSTPELGSGLGKPPITGVAVQRQVGIETAVLEPQKFVVPAPPELFDGGGF